MGGHFIQNYAPPRASRELNNSRWSNHALKITCNGAISSRIPFIAVFAQVKYMAHRSTLGKRANTSPSLTGRGTPRSRCLLRISYKYESLLVYSTSNSLIAWLKYVYLRRTLP